MAALFWKQVLKGAHCWVWQGRTTADGYGIYAVWLKGKYVSGAHRVAYTPTYGTIPDDLVVRHRCANPPCVNPYHLLVGGDWENMLDAVVRRKVLARSPHTTMRGAFVSAEGRAAYG